MVFGWSSAGVYKQASERSKYVLRMHNELMTMTCRSAVLLRLSPLATGIAGHRSQGQMARPGDTWSGSHVSMVYGVGTRSSVMCSLFLGIIILILLFVIYGSIIKCDMCLCAYIKFCV